MARKTPDPDTEPLELILLERDAPPPRGFARPALLAGVALACLAGAGAGLWARPAVDERRLPAASARPLVRPQAPPELQVVVDEAPPPPIGAPLQVLEIIPGPSAMSIMPWSLPTLEGPAAPSPAPELAPPPEPEPQVAPRRAPEGLVRVAARASEPEPAPRKAEKPVEKKPVAKPEKKEKAAAGPSEKKKPKATKDEKARGKTLASKDKPKPKVKLAKAKTRDASVSKAPKTPEKKLAAVKAKPKPKAAPVKMALAKPKPVAAKPALVKAPAPKVEKAVVRPPSAPASKPAPPVVAPRPAQVQIAQAPRNPCTGLAGADALVCADPGLRAAEREMSRAYRTAEDAGVPSGRLRQQQRRWLAAREVAANEAPWAVRDVYEARISELEDLSRDYSQP